MYVGMVIASGKGKDQPGKVANPVRGELWITPLSPFASENLLCLVSVCCSLSFFRPIFVLVRVCTSTWLLVCAQIALVCSFI